MKNYILLLLLFSFLNSAEDYSRQQDDQEHLLPANKQDLIEPQAEPSYLPFSTATNSLEFFTDGEDAAESSLSSPARLDRMSSSVLNESAEREYHESHPQLFYAPPEEKLSAKIKNFGKILRCGTSVNIERVAYLLSQMPKILEKVQKNFDLILKNVKAETAEYQILFMYKESVGDIERKINSAEPFSVSELLAIFGNINASIIAAQNTVSQLIKKRLTELSQEVENNSGMQLITNSVSSQFKENISGGIKRISNATKLLDEFSNAQKDILSFSNLLQDFFLQGRTEQGRVGCVTEDLLTALKGN